MRIAELDLKRELFPLSFNPENDPRPSTEIMAMVFAVIPGAAGFRPIGGYRFLKQEKPETSVHAAIVPADTPRAELLRICLASEQALGPLNEIEKARALQAARNLPGAGNRVPDDVMSLLGLSPNNYIRERYAAALELDSEWQSLIAAGHPRIKAAPEIKACSAEDRELLKDIFRQARFSVRMQDRFLEGLRDLRKREHGGLAPILIRWDAEKILTPPDLKPGEKGARLLACLEGDLRPGYSRDLAAFRRLKQCLGSDEGISIETDPAFETGQMRFVFEASSIEEYKRKIAKLAARAEDSDFSQLFEL